MCAVLGTRRAISVRSLAAPPWLARVLWALLSVALFCSIWELCWLLGWADPRLLPPPHVFLGGIAGQAKYFNTVSRWQVGVGMDSGPSPAMAVVYTAGATIGRVVAGLLIATMLSITIGVAIPTSACSNAWCCPPSRCSPPSPRVVDSPSPDRSLIFQETSLFPWLTVGKT